jgi:membrane protein insertase Oxa1/YidC/SpoIIIJ
VIGLVILSLLAAVMQYLLSKQMSPSTDNGKRLRDVLAEAGQGKEADQAELNAIVMRKMTKVMPIFLFFVMVSLPGALALYMATGNIVAYFQNASILKKDEEEMEALSSETTKEGKKSAKERAKKATEAKITKITAKDK